MKNILIGLIFVFFNLPLRITEWFGWDLELGIIDMVIDILPAFVGYGLIAAGLISMRGKTKNFTYSQWIAVSCVPIELVRWTCASLGLSLEGFGRGLQIIVFIATVVMLFCFIKGLDDITAEQKANIGQNALRRSWYVMVVVDLVVFFFGTAMQMDGMLLAPSLLGYLDIIVRVIFLLFFWRMTKKYYNYSK